MNVNHKNQDLHEYFCFAQQKNGQLQEPRTNQPAVVVSSNLSKNIQLTASSSISFIELEQPPSASTATLDLIKHLKLYLELRRFFPLDISSSSISTTTRRSHLSTNSSNHLQQHQQNAYHQPIRTERDDKEENLYIDDDDDEDSDSESRIEISEKVIDSEQEDEDEHSRADANSETEYDSEDFCDRKREQTVKAESGDGDEAQTEMNQLKPMLPYYFYSDTFSSFVNDEPFIGRDWIFKEIERAFDSNQVVLISGQSGTGKTKLAHNLFRLGSVYQNTRTPATTTTIKGHHPSSIQTKYLASNLAAVHTCLPDDRRTHQTKQFIHTLAWSLQHLDHLNKVVSTNGNKHKDTVNLYAQCLTENNSAILRRLLLKQKLSRLSSVNAAAKAKAAAATNALDRSLIEKLSSSSSSLASSPNHTTTSNSSASNPSAAATTTDYSDFMSSLLDLSILFKQCVLDPVESLLKTQTVKFSYFYVIVDGLDFVAADDEAGECSPAADVTEDEKQNNLRQFLLKQLALNQLPKWFKLLITVRDDKPFCSKQPSRINSCHCIRLDTGGGGNFNLVKDLNDYVNFRIGKSIDVQKNILCLNLSCSNSPSNHATATAFDVNFQNKFTQHLVKLSAGNYLYLRLLMNLIERGMLVIKSANFNAIPKDFSHLLKLYFNLKFKTSLSYDRLASILFSILLCARSPLKLRQIYDLLRPVTLSTRLGELTEQININLSDFLAPLLYYDPVVDNVDSHLHSQQQQHSPSSHRRQPFYVFKHAAIRDWWLQQQQQTHAHSLNLAESLLGMRLFRLERVNLRLVLEHLGYLLSSMCLDSKTLLYLLTVSLPQPFRLEYVLVSAEFLFWPDRRVFELLVSNCEHFFSNLFSLKSIPPLLCLLASLGHVGMIRQLLDKFNAKLGDFNSSSLNSK